MRRGKTVKPQSFVMTGTKWEIFSTAVDLFAIKGFANVGIRDIADAVGIKSASIYNHFGSKEILLDEMYRYFYYHHSLVLPDTNALLEQIPNSDPYEILDSAVPPFGNKRQYEVIRKIILVAMKELSNDKNAEILVNKEIVSALTGRISAILNKMLELDMIEPIDVDLFSSIFVTYSLAAVWRVGSRYNMSFLEWKTGRRMLFRLIRVKK